MLTLDDMSILVERDSTGNLSALIEAGDECVEAIYRFGIWILPQDESGHFRPILAPVAAQLQREARKLER